MSFSFSKGVYFSPKRNLRLLHGISYLRLYRIYCICQNIICNFLVAYNNIGAVIFILVNLEMVVLAWSILMCVSSLYWVAEMLIWLQGYSHFHDSLVSQCHFRFMLIFDVCVFPFVWLGFVVLVFSYSIIENFSFRVLL